MDNVTKIEKHFLKKVEDNLIIFVIVRSEYIMYRYF